MPPHPFADRWNHNTHYYPLLRQHIPDEASTILDIGAGEGSLARFLAHPGRTVIGIDPDSSVLPEAAPGIEFRVGSAEYLPVEDASVDAATLVMVLHHTNARQGTRRGGTDLAAGRHFRFAVYGRVDKYGRRHLAGIG